MKIRNILFTTIAAAILTACGSSKSIQQQPTNGNAGTITTPQQPTITQPKNVVAKLDINISDKSKGSSMSVDGKLQMRYNEVVRLLITPYGIMEAGRLEFTPDYVLLVNRINKEYVRARYDEVDFLKKNGITFSTIQENFWKEYKKEHITLNIDKMALKIDVKKVTNDSNWDATTTVSDKFKQVSLAEVLGKLGGF